MRGTERKTERGCFLITMLLAHSAPDFSQSRRIQKCFKCVRTKNWGVTNQLTGHLRGFTMAARGVVPKLLLLLVFLRKKSQRREFSQKRAKAGVVYPQELEFINKPLGQFSEPWGGESLTLVLGHGRS